MGRKRLVEIGRKYNRLTIVGFIIKNSILYCNCLCDCGRSCETLSSGILSGRTKSCGCYKAELNRKRLQKPYGVASINELILNYKYHAKLRNLEYSLTYEQFVHLTSLNCYYCDMEPRQVSKSTNMRDRNQVKEHRSESGSYIYNGIDRFDNSKGYTIDNCVPCCKRCNMLKGSITLELIESIYNRIKERLEQ